MKESGLKAVQEGRGEVSVEVTDQSLQDESSLSRAARPDVKSASGFQSEQRRVAAEKKEDSFFFFSNQ